MPRRMAFVKVLCNKACNISKDPKYGYHCRLNSVVFKFFDLKSSGSVVTLEVKLCQTNNKQKNYINQLLEFEKWKLHSSFKGNIWDGWSRRYAINR